MIALGHIVGPHATRGELRMRPFNPASTAIHPGCTVVLRTGQAHDVRQVRTVRRHKDYLLLTLDGCDSMDAAYALKGREVCVERAHLPALGPGEIYHWELVGMAVLTTAGESLGTVAEVLPTPGNDICVVRSTAREYLIPLIADIVTEIDRAGRRLLIDPLPGLLDE